MTICIGLLATDGILIATDREMNDSVQKLDEGKVRGRCINAPPYDAILIAGSGDSVHSQTASEKVFDSFNPAAGSLPKVREDIGKQHKDGGARHIWPSTNPLAC